MNTGIYNTILNRAQGMTVAWIAEETDLSASTVRRYLAEMVKRGEVIASPYGRGTIYTRTQERRTFGLKARED